MSLRGSLIAFVTWPWRVREWRRRALAVETLASAYYTTVLTHEGKPLREAGHQVFFQVDGNGRHFCTVDSTAPDHVAHHRGIRLARSAWERFGELPVYHTPYNAGDPPPAPKTKPRFRIIPGGRS